MARLLEAAHSPSDAMRFWRRAAKQGDVEAQLRAGLAAYHGSCDVGQDPDAAAMWLGRALKAVQQADAAAEAAAERRRAAAADGAGGGSSSSSPAAPVAAIIIPPAVRLRVLREAALVLGYLHFDGEGVATDKAKSCTLFKIAADAGCNEAAQVRGWMFNTGQYE
jgi:TPR repeat protein